MSAKLLELYQSLKHQTKSLKLEYNHLNKAGTLLMARNFTNTLYNRSK